MTEELKIAVIAGGASVMGGLVSGAYQHARDFFSRPHLGIDYKRLPGNRVEVNNDIFIRARIQNKGRLGAKGVRVFLAGLKEVENATLTETAFYDPLVLSWPGWEFTARDIPSGIEMYVDVLRISKELDQAGWNFAVQRLFTSHDKLQSYSGIYRFYLLATAENAAPAICELDVTYRKDWRGLREIEHKRHWWGR